MFVKISLDYQWFGENTDISFVGPFDTKTSAEQWEIDFQKLISTHALSGKTEITDKPDTHRRLFTPEVTPVDTYDQLYKSLVDYCSGGPLG